VGIHGKIARKKSEKPECIPISMRSIATKDDPVDGKV